MRATLVAGLLVALCCAAVAASRAGSPADPGVTKGRSAPSALDRFLPARPPDSRPARAAEAIQVQRFGEAATILEDYVEDRPDDGDARVQLGWALYRLGRFEQSRAQFEETLRRDPNSDDARVGIGYTLLQLSGGNEAAGRFREVLARDAMHRDALEGMVLAGRRGPVSAAVHAEAIEAARRLEAMSKTFRPELLPAGSERRLRGPLSADTPLAVPARALRNTIEIEVNGAFQPIFLKGFNLGTGLPGRFPAEFPSDQALYASWLQTMAEIGANVVRVYTLLPPEFYRALRAWNAAHPTQRIWLVQGVWAELPPAYDFSSPHYVREFRAEIARVIDAVHGNLVLGPRAGHAFGVYDADASASLLAYIIGREWEPYAVSEYNKLHADRTHYEGRWLRVASGRPMETWVAAVCDYAADYEASRYRVLHPLTFANWPTLDPLDHPSEANRHEEDYWRDRYGVPFPTELAGLPWEDDAVSLDATLIEPTEAMAAGFFAAYHIYPNYPEFMNVDAQYDGGRDAKGPSRYAAYLAALAKYHGDQPVVVAEFGMSTSRGVAHVHPQGWNHGGMTEKEQGAVVSRMMRDIHDQGYAGAIVFSFVDEWFKSTWSVAPFESPGDQRRLWFNAENPEESYGVLAARPAAASITIDGSDADWKAVPALAAKP